MIDARVTGDGCDDQVLEGLDQAVREQLLEGKLWCEYCHRIYPADYVELEGGPSDQCVHCYFTSAFGELTEDYVHPDPSETGRFAGEGLVRYVQRFLPTHDSGSCWQVDLCFLCDAREREVDLENAGAVAAWLAVHGYPAPEPRRPFVYLDEDETHIRHSATGLELEIVRAPGLPPFAVMARPLTNLQVARLLGNDGNGVDHTPWTGFDLHDLRSLYRDHLRLPTALEREAATRLDKLEVVPGLRELAHVSGAGMEIVDPSTGDVIHALLPDLGKLDAIGQRIPNVVPLDVGLRLALGDLDELVGRGQRMSSTRAPSRSA